MNVITRLIAAIRYIFTGKLPPNIGQPSPAAAAVIQKAAERKAADNAEKVKTPKEKTDSTAGTDAAPKKDKLFSFRVDVELLDDFREATALTKSSASALLRQYMADYVAATRSASEAPEAPTEPPKSDQQPPLPLG